MRSLIDSCETCSQYIERIYKHIAHDIEEAYDITPFEGEPISSLLTRTQDRFLFIFDEWDSIFNEQFMTMDDHALYMKFLKGLLKDKAYVGLAYMTGMLPIRYYPGSSHLNMFDEYSLTNDYIFDDYFGFLEGEVKSICIKQDKISFSELKQWYNGNYTSTGGKIYNPYSVRKALDTGKCQNY